MTYDLPDYFKATNLAYEVLLKNKQLKLPIRVTPLIKEFPNIRLLTYSGFASEVGIPLKQAMEYSPSDFGFTLKKRNKYIIVVNETLPYGTYRFTLAHELGHCLLGHSCDDVISKKEANCFARNLLCPYPIRCELRLSNVDDYVKTFCVSQEMANVTLKMHNDDKINIIMNLEDQITENFSKYILAYGSTADKRLYA